MAQATDSSVSGKVASYLSRLNPIPRLPEYTGPYKVGTIDVEIPVSDLDSPSPVPTEAAEIETIQFRIFYPAQPDSEGKRITWLPAPQRDHLSAYIKFLGVGPFWAQAASFLPRHLHYTSIPVIKNAPLHEPPPETPNGRWPTAIFSHGLGGNRNAYSQVAGSLASHGVVVVCPEHRDGSSAVSFVRIPSAQDRYFARSKRREIPYQRIPHEVSEEVHELRDAQLRIRLWELGLLHEAILALDEDEDGSPQFTNLNISTPPRALAQFANRLHVRDPGSIIFMGHSFGAATVVQFLKTVYYADHPDVAAIEAPLFAPAPGSAVRTQITPRNVTILLDMWCFPLVAASQKALFDRPLPVYAVDDNDETADAPGGAALLAVESEDFFKWNEHLHASARALSPDPKAPVVEASAFSCSPSSDSDSDSDSDSNHDDAPKKKEEKKKKKKKSIEKPHFFYVRKAAHLNQSDFGVLFPLLTRRVFGSEEPERALRLNLRAVLQVLRENGVPVARTSFADLVDGGGGGDGSGGGESIAAAAGYDKLAAVEGEDSDAEAEAEAEAGDHSAEKKEEGVVGAVVNVDDGIHDDKAIFDCSGSVAIDAWEWIDVVGMGRVVDKEDGETKDGTEVAEKQETEMAHVIEPSVANGGGGGGGDEEEAAAAAVVTDVARVASATAA